MSAVPKRRMTEDEYLAFEEASETKHEFFGGAIFDMAGASVPHNDISTNLIVEIGSRLEGGSCHVYSYGKRVKVERTGLDTYPDLVIVDGPSAYVSDDAHTLMNPHVVFEIMPSERNAVGHRSRFEHYQTLPSVREYAWVCSSSKWVQRFVRQTDETWILTFFDDPAGAFSLVTVPVTIPLADVYRDVEPVGEALRPAVQRED